MTSPLAPVIESSLVQRLETVMPMLTEDPAPPAVTSSPRRAGDLLDALVRAVKPQPTPSRVWLLMTAVAGAFPTTESVVDGRWALRRLPVTESTLWLLDHALSVANTRVAQARMRLVVGKVVVDVDHTAQHDLHTGIQQVVRRTLPLWAARHDILCAVWTEPAQALRTLTADEADRVFRWEQASPERHDRASFELLVPWRSVVVLPEVPFPEACDRLAALAQCSGNRMVAIGYDCIPAVSADMVPATESNRFARYLTVVKHLRRVACIGSTPLAEFGGFVSALSVQGMVGPLVMNVPLPVPAVRAAELGERRESAAWADRPLVLSVGTFEPRKNQLALLYAAERLWREGLSFELALIGGSGWIDAVPAMVSRLQEAGRPVRLVEKAGASELRASYRRARFTVFTSLHEGFGLPIAESFEQGTPVITTGYGSTGELASGGGALVVDPYDDEELVDAMRRMLTDDGMVRRLRQEISNRSVRSWSHYAEELWEAVVAPELSAVNAQEDRPL